MRFESARALLRWLDIFQWWRGFWIGSHKRCCGYAETRIFDRDFFCRRFFFSLSNHFAQLVFSQWKKKLEISSCNLELLIFACNWFHCYNLSIIFNFFWFSICFNFVAFTSLFGSFPSFRNHKQTKLNENNLPSSLSIIIRKWNTIYLKQLRELCITIIKMRMHQKIIMQVRCLCGLAPSSRFHREMFHCLSHCIGWNIHILATTTKKYEKIMRIPTFWVNARFNSLCSALKLLMNDNI